MVTKAADDELSDALARVLGTPVRHVVVRRSRYSTSHPIDNIDATLANSEVLSFVRKDLAWPALLREARESKPAFLHDPRREIAVYTELLPSAPPGAPHCYGTSCDAARQRWWLFLERVRAIELFQVGELSWWEAVAAWLGRLHVIFASMVDELHAAPIPLLEHGRRWHARWAERALAAAATPPTAAIQRLHRLVPPLTECLAAMPATLVHGELYASNVLVAPDTNGLRVCPIDWETAALAPGLVDLAALTAGDWSEQERGRIERSYCVAVNRVHDASFRQDLDACRLSLCIQWLGWSPGWRPPAGHAHDWLGEAMALADGLGLE
jgi:hypothetical protein